jgi:NDP-sugar pyrophosphorylase family protein
MGSVKNYWMEQQELQPMYEWIEENYGSDIDESNESEWSAAVVAYNKCMEGAREQEDYEHAADEYNYYIHLNLEEADDKFETEYSNLLQLVHEVENKNQKIIYKMCYAHAVTIFEVYMEDIAKTLITRDDDFLNSYLRNSNVISSKQYSLNDIVFKNNFIEQNTKIESLRKDALNALSKILYHDIDKVINVFQSMLGRDFVIDKVDMKKIVYIRHDVVHRNGVNPNGVTHKITKETVVDAMSILKESASRIRYQLGKLPR